MNSAEMAMQIAVSGIVIGCIYALVAWGFTIVYNATGLINFAAGEFVMMGGVIYATLDTALPSTPIVTVPTTITLVAAAAASMDRFGLQRARRRNHLTLVMITIGIAIAFRGIMLFVGGKEFLFPSPLSYFEVPPIMGVVLSAQNLWVMGTTMGVAVLLWLLFSRTWLGRAMRAAGENPRAALLMGISPLLVSTIAFTIAGAMGAIAGVLIAPIASANYMSGLFFGLKGFAAAILGGIGSPIGAVVGGFALGLMESFAAGYISSGWKDAIALAILILALLIRPTGIFGASSVRRV
ncbi:branched-chain amino acid ABC transporter permease [Mesorhizobium sp. CCNWLW179-1]|uniref:branched-chain amino acid ABC transporter permease n=1 Tax=unclassified Mesorhizobium TaxID=325217 RepID=UPI0030156C5D